MQKSFSENIDNVMLRGSQVIHMGECQGLVLHVGVGTRIMMNSKEAPRRLSDIEVA